MVRRRKLLPLDEDESMMESQVSRRRNNSSQRRWVRSLAIATSLACSCWGGQPIAAQSVCLPAPRLMTIMPMGGQAGTEFDVTISGQSIDEVEALIFFTSVDHGDCSRR